MSCGFGEKFGPGWKFLTYSKVKKYKLPAILTISVPPVYQRPFWVEQRPKEGWSGGWYPYSSSWATFQDRVVCCP